MTTSVENIRVLQGLTEDQREIVCGRMDVRRYGAGSIVVMHNDNNREVYFILEGAVRSTVYTVKGREVSYQDIYAGDMFGEIAAIDGLPRTTHVVTLEDSVLAVMSEKNFRATLQDFPTVAMATMERLAATIRMLAERILEYGALPVRGRLIDELIRIHRGSGPCDDKDHVSIDNPPTHATLASRIGSHREAVTRELNQLHRDGLISKTRNCIEIPSLAALEKEVKQLSM